MNTFIGDLDSRADRTNETGGGGSHLLGWVVLRILFETGRVSSCVAVVGVAVVAPSSQLWNSRILEHPDCS